MIVVVRSEDKISGSAKVFWQQVPRKIGPLSGFFPKATEVFWDFSCLQQVSFIGDWLPGAFLRQQFLPSGVFEQQHVPLQQQDDSPDADPKQNLLIEPSGQRQS